MPRYKISLEFDGTDYAGWQRQKNAGSIQAALETAINQFCGEMVVVNGAGRTDAGVHALAMVAHMDLSRAWRADQVRDAVNFHLRPQPIVITAAEQVSDEFHARFSCTRRSYEYRILNRRAPAALQRNHAWWIPEKLDAHAMAEATSVLLGKHDFTTFRASQCQAQSPIKTLSHLSVQHSQQQIVVQTYAPSYLHHQVRSIVGSLVEIGRGKWTAANLKQALMAADRKACGPVAPASGLYFVSAEYDSSPDQDT